MTRAYDGFDSEDGATAVEYAIMVSLIAAIIVLVVIYMGRQTKSGFCDLQGDLAKGGVSSQVGTAADGC